jgi:glycosyltransferase involved in cell wall biosynthesis
MRIGYDAKRFYNNFTGLGNYSRTLVSNLSEYYPGEEYFLYTPRTSSDPTVTRFLNKDRIITRVARTPFRSLWRSMSVVRQIKKDNIAIFHGLSGEIPIGLRGRRIKSIVSVHDLIFLVYPETYKPADRFLYDLKFKYACKTANKIIAISKSTKDDLIKYYDIDPSAIKVIYQACDQLFYEAADNTAMKEVTMKYGLPKEFLLYVGSVIKRKNLLTVIRSLAILPENFSIPLVIVGDGKAYKNEVKNLIAAVKLEKRIIWIEDLHDSRQLKALYNLASVFLYPSIYEGFGIPVAESLLSKVPVITSNCSSLPEAGGPSSVLVDPGSAEEISVQIEKVLGDTGLREKMINDGYKYAIETFSPQVTSEEMMKAYLEVSG